uniref:Nose resistant-to-fluoxetine protein N-terminal domain-containing protein n=1 Tax=Acrobeloides nanus TaxID=290746 RepID=A0A914CSG5_9BILA
MILFIGLLVLTSEIFVGSQVIPREAFERIRNFDPKEYSYAPETEWPTWNTFFKKFAQNPNILGIDIDPTCAYDLVLPWNVLNTSNTQYENFDKQPFLEFLDSGGVVGPGILKGHQWFYGLYSECKAVSYAIPSGNHTFEGLYTRILISQNILLNASLSGYMSPGACESVFGLDICAPKSCSDEDLLKAFRQFGVMNDPDSSSVCGVKTMRDEYFKKKDFGTWFVV